MLLVAATAMAVVGTVLGHRGARGRAAPAVRPVKTAVPVLLLAALAAARWAPPGAAWGPAGLGLFVAAGLVGTAVADWFLAPVDNSRTFVLGLAGFLVGYLLYGVGLVRVIVAAVPPPEAGLGGGGAAGPAVAVVATYAVVLAVGVLQYRSLTTLPANLRVPVAAYLLVVSNLLAAGVLVAHAAPLVAVGTAGIYLSDSLIARHLFRKPLSSEELWIMPTYYLGQIGVVVGTILLLPAG